jgi:carbonic anhydrase
MKLHKIIIGSLLAASTLLAGGHGTHWGYTGHEGPTSWGDLDAKYTMCKAGSSQSPINITKKVTVESDDLKDIKFNYRTGATEVVNNGHTIQVNVAGESFIEVDGIKFSLKQFHFHTPSENQIDGKNFPLEAHFVHVSDKGELAVVAVLFEDGKENSVLKKIWNKMPHNAGETSGCGLSSKVINSILPKDKDYYRFSGSLTTPPCSEGVRWLVMEKYSHISAAQTKEFLDIFHHANNRPIQAINARKVMQAD